MMCSFGNLIYKEGYTSDSKTQIPSPVAVCQNGNGRKAHDKVANSGLGYSLRFGVEYGEARDCRGI